MCCQKSLNFEYLSVDATIKCCMGVMGQASYKVSSAVRNAAAFDDAASLRRVLTVRGRTGAVLAIPAIPSEKAEHISTALLAALPGEGLCQVKSVATDDPSIRLFASLKAILCQI